MTANAGTPSCGMDSRTAFFTAVVFTFGVTSGGVRVSTVFTSYRQITG